MSRDRRGNPGRYFLKNQPRLSLTDVLRRRRTTLKQLLAELGITTYNALDIWCGRMGVSAPTLQQFQAAVPPTSPVNSPTEGVVVLEAPPMIEERTGRLVELEEETVEGPPESPQKKRRAKKDDQPSEA